MLINIITTQLKKNRITGPRKVLNNTLKGLDKIGVKYVFNQPMNKYKYNWIHDDQKAIIEAGFIGKPVLVGPNTAVLPRDLPKIRKKLPKGSIYLHPSEWCIDVWKLLGFNEAKLDCWAVGIDVEEFQSIDRSKRNKILLYFKQRELKLLDEAKRILLKNNLEFELITYGFYKENEYKNILKKCKFGIWIGCSESQGIALQEALATNLPLIVLDAKSMFDTVPIKSKNYFPYKFPKNLRKIRSTSAPYFDERCGIIIDKITQLEQSVEIMQNNINKYQPRQYIIENLSLEKSAQKFVDFFLEMNIKNEKKYCDYSVLSKILFYISLIGQQWAWQWLFHKVLFGK